ncbi:unnamed protein product [Acanthoscelides obtectus]|uniref:Uncharacterized protein n=1 Tax=Acanthoscelides obtectus TaxID=200917 RepID=A0A9P0PNF6_ACAOB|nr:unnamed protein product [Acanthoscelides obtectus]CAK1655275.1 hypothetical protein AOBTE_LOCUS19120 [Acanthoscelides obtectus]
MSKKKNKTDEGIETTIDIEDVKSTANSEKKTSIDCEYLEKINEKLRREVEQQSDKFSLYVKLLTEKDKIIHQLTKEDRRFQKQYDLLRCHIAEKESITYTLKKVSSGIQVIEKVYRVSEPKMMRPKIKIVCYRSHERITETDRSLDKITAYPKKTSKLTISSILP